MNQTEQNAAAARQLREKGKAIDIDTLRQAMNAVGKAIPDEELDLLTGIQLATLVAKTYEHLFEQRALAIENEKYALIRPDTSHVR